MAECVRHVYATTAGHGEIRRVNINAAPLDHDGYATVKAAGIGTYQIFQETYHHETYAPRPPEGHAKGRLPLAARRRGPRDGGRQCDDVGIGALFGLYDWRFEVLGLVSHALHLQKHYNVRPAHDQLPAAAAGLRRADRRNLPGQRRRTSSGWWPSCGCRCPTPGLICTAREPPAVRREVHGLRRLADRRRQPRRDWAATPRPATPR